MPPKKKTPPPRRPTYVVFNQPKTNATRRAAPARKNIYTHIGKGEKFSRHDLELVHKIKENLAREHMKKYTPKFNAQGQEVINQSKMRTDASLNSEAIRKYKIWKNAGLTSPTPSPKKVEYAKIKKSPIVVVGSPLKIFKGQSPTHRIRIGKKLITSFTKGDLLKLYASKGVKRAHEKMTKAELIALVVAKAASPILAPITKKTKLTRAEKLLKHASKFKSLKYKTKANIQGYADRHKIPGVSQDLTKVHMINVIENKLKKNISAVLNQENPSTVTRRIVIDKLVQSHGWHPSRNINKQIINDVFMRKYS